MQKGDTISGVTINGQYANIKCYGVLPDGTAKVYVIYPDGKCDRMYYRDGILAYKRK
jgi:hypothetical protein